VIVFGVAVGDVEIYRRYAEPGLRLAAEPDAEVLAVAAVRSRPRTYNLLLDVAAAHEDLEALVIVDPHVEITDPAFCTKVREALRDPDVAVVGCAGAAGVRSIAWWEGAVSSAPLIHRYEEHRGGELPAFAWTEPGPAPADVDAVDGLLMALSPWAVRNLRFDEGLRSHGFEFDLCMQARAAGRRVVTADLRATQHRSLELVGEIDRWIDAHITLAERWGGDEPDEDAWRRRARRAEAEREAAHALAYFKGLVADARIGALERAMDEATSSTSWRMTAPLRRMNHLRAQALRRRRNGA
jgi:hypothetical protein